MYVRGLRISSHSRVPSRDSARVTAARSAAPRFQAPSPAGETLPHRSRLDPESSTQAFRRVRTPQAVAERSNLLWDARSKCMVRRRSWLGFVRSGRTRFCPRESRKSPSKIRSSPRGRNYLMRLGELVEQKGIEPSTSALRTLTWIPNALFQLELIGTPTDAIPIEALIGTYTKLAKS